MTAQAPKPVFRVEPGPFLAAYIGGPLLFTLCTFWIFYIPLFALFIGGPIYAVVGLPIGYLHLRHSPGTTGGTTAVAVLTVLALSTAYCLFEWGAGGQVDLTGALVLSLFAILFAACWSATAGTIYNALRSDESRHPITERPRHEPN